MLIAKNDEEKRSKIWRIVTFVTSVLIVLIAAFFLLKLFTDNPLEGNWKHEDSNLEITIKGNGTMYVLWDDLYEGSNIKIGMKYVLDKENKTIAFQIDETMLTDAAKESEGALTKEGVRSDLSVLETTYDYNIEREKLTLTEREYGDQMIFHKK